MVSPEIAGRQSLAVLHFIQLLMPLIPAEKIIWEAPQKAQQLYFLELLGCNVNLGNIAPNEIIPLEAMRIGLRGDTFDLYRDK